jgi:hypothetical protein
VTPVNRRPHTWTETAVCIAAVVVVGCTSGDPNKSVAVRGRVIQNGRPLKFLPNEDVSIGFSAADAALGSGGFGASAGVNAVDGTFTVTGRNHTGVPPGRYRVSLSSQVGCGNVDRFEKLFDGKKPPLIVEISPGGDQAVVIDVDNWTATKE